MEIKLDQFKKTLEGFDFLINTNLDELREVIDERLIDGIENGKAQKFEICMELCGKTIKGFLKEQEGIDAKSPKQSVKEFYLTGYLSEESYMTLISAIDDRNALAHIYRDEVFQQILKQFPGYLAVFKQVIESIETKIK